jgi:hypothetical protein
VFSSKEYLGACLRRNRLVASVRGELIRSRVDEQLEHWWI